MPREKAAPTDAFATLVRGMNSSLSPDLIREDQVAFAINRTFRKGYCRTRPRFQRINLDFQGEEEVETWFNGHGISGSAYYLPPSGQPLLVVACGGRMFSFEIVGTNAANVRDVTPTEDDGGRFASNVRLTWFCQAAQYLIAQNGQDEAYIFDGASGRRAVKANNEVPTGRQMAYVNQRLFVVSTNGREILPGDLAGVTSTSVLEFTEISGPAVDGGQPLSLPLEAGEITTLVPTAQLDTQYGQGILLACTATAICSFNPIIQRSQWAQIQLQNIALIGNGFTSDGCAIVNGDVWGRSLDGWRSFVMARREFSSWGNTPQSSEIEIILQNDTQTLLDHADFVYFDNRLLGTVSPVNLQDGVYHRGMVALDFDNISGLGEKTVPAYDGLWTGIMPYSLVTGQFAAQDRCFAFCKNESLAKNELWEITKEFGDDNGECRIEGFIDTRSFTFKYPILWKEINDFEFWVDQMRGRVDFEIQYRPDQFPCWLPWRSFTQCAKVSSCEDPITEGCQVPTSYESQYRPKNALGQPPQSCIPIINRQGSFGYEFQLRIKWTGNVRLRAGVIYANFKDIVPEVTDC